MSRYPCELCQVLDILSEPPDSLYQPLADEWLRSQHTSWDRLNYSHKSGEEQLASRIIITIIALISIMAKMIADLVLRLGAGGLM